MRSCVEFQQVCLSFSRLFFSPFLPFFRSFFLTSQLRALVACDDLQVRQLVQPLLVAVEDEVVALATENAALRKENSALKRV
jgi:hypothetical protein